jgi:hypothetical protein
MTTEPIPIDPADRAELIQQVHRRVFDALLTFVRPAGPVLSEVDRAMIVAGAAGLILAVITSPSVAAMRLRELAATLDDSAPPAH